MKPRLIVLCLTLILFVVSVASSQTPTTTQTQSTGKPTTAQSQSLDIIYTGKLLGYFRVPSLQPKKPFKGCHQSSADDSAPARTFLQKRRQHEGAILVGTGDNFAPELEARSFSIPFQNEKFVPANKELYFGNYDEWIGYEELQQDQYKKLRDDIAAGHGTIPTDNVGCFLRAAHYSAIVPGKHDFYFGVERVRQFARLLAEPLDGESQPVQMLGANIVIKTSSLNYTPGPSKITGDMKFNEWPKELTVSNLKDGGTVYPSLPIVKIDLGELKLNDQFINSLNQTYQNYTAALDDFVKAVPELKGTQDPKLIELNKLRANSVQSQSIKLCQTTKGPNELDATQSCAGFSSAQVTWSDKKFTLSLTLNPVTPPNARGHFYTLSYGINYGLCVSATPGKDAPNQTAWGCLRFNAYQPFFNHPHPVSLEKANGYTDPLPYVINNGVAIFGVVDPNLAEQIGVLNLGWKNAKSDLTSRVSIEDPVEALRQQLDYFAVQAKNEDVKLKVLLFQGNPQRAKALAAKFSEFQIVVSAADQEQGTSEAKMYTVWRPRKNGSFIAVPTPYFNASSKKQAVQFGVVTASTKDPKDSWNLTADNQDAIEVSVTNDEAKLFWDKVEARVGGNPKLPSSETCAPTNFKREDDEQNTQQAYLKWLVLCAMRDYTKADVALIQKRDLFDQIPDIQKSESKLLDRANLQITAAGADENIQQTLDRLIWKGDLITLLYVPGSALKNVLKQSETFAAEESSSLALAVEKGRSLEKLGVRKENGEDLVNGVPIDDKKIYAVATTDYIGAGDTGYPDFVKAALNPRTHPAAFTGELVPISSLVCSLLATPALFCHSPIISRQYIDVTEAKVTPTYKSQNWFKRALDTSGFSWPKENEEPTTTTNAVEQRIQRRGIWSFSLKQLSFGIKDLDNNRTDDNVSRTFGGIPTSGVNSKGSHTTTVFLDSRLSYSGYKNEFFIAGGIDFDKSSTGEPNTNIGETDLSKVVTLSKNKLTGDLGVIFWRRPGRSAKTVGAVVSLHGETQFQGPFSIYKLNTGTNDRIKIDQDRSLLLMFRFGARWQGKQNYFEAGAQVGRELKALKGYVFEMPGTSTPCDVSFAITLGACILKNSTLPQPLITMGTESSVLLEGRPRAGIYWNHGFSIPFTPKLSYSVTQSADFFFVRWKDTTVDTRFHYTSKNSLDFKVWPSLSFGPTLDLLLYQNKVNRDVLFQYQFGIGTKISFDLFNRRERGAQVKQQP